MTKAEKIQFKTTNTVTGEIFTTEINPYDPDSMAECLQDIQAMAKNLKALEADVKSCMMDYLHQNDDKPVPVLGGKFDMKVIAGSKKVYSANTALNLFDQDELISREILTVATGKYEDMLAEMVEADQLRTEDSMEIARTTDRKPISPYVKLEKVSVK